MLEKSHDTGSANLTVHPNISSATVTGSTVLMAVGVVLAAGFVIWLFGERGRLLRPSTRRLIWEGGWKRALNLGTAHAYVYHRWFNQYVGLLINFIFPHVISRFSPRAKKWLADRYHGKVLTPELARAIITLDRDIPLSQLEQIVPYPRARDLVLKGPPDIAVYECACRHARSHPCQPTQVCMIIGQPFVDFILEHNPHSSRRLTQSEALDLLRAEHERGHLHSAWFKDACMGRFYAICNCCPCCCGGIEAMVKYETPAVASSGFVARVDEALCTACGICEEACPFGAIRVVGGAVIDWESCMGCGVCVGQCAQGALSLVRDERKGLPLDVRVLAGEQAEPWG